MKVPFGRMPAALGGLMVAGMLVAAPMAQASPVQVRDPDGGSTFGGLGGVSLTINVDGSNINVLAGAFALEYRVDPSDPWTAFFTYCLEPNEPLGISGTTPVSGTLEPDISASPYAGKADSLMRIFATWFADSLTDATKSAAFQVALWELAYDTGSDLAAGAFRYTFLTPVQSQALSYLDPSNWLGAAPLGVILRVGNQDLLVETEAPTNPDAIPEPGTLALFGLGLAGLAATRRRRLGA